MTTYKSLYEEEDSQDFYLLQDRDLIVVIKEPHTAEEADKALNTKDNYGRYISTMRSSKVSDKDVENYFGPRSPNVRNANQKKRFEKFKEANPESQMDYNEWLTKGPVGTDMGPYPIRTKDNYDAFVNKFITKPNLLSWGIKGNTLVFPKDFNPGRNEIKSIVTTVLTNAGFGEKTFTFKTDVSEAKIKAMIREEIRNVLKENFESFDNLESAIKHHEKGDGYYDRARLIAIFNQLQASDQQKARIKYSEYFGKKNK